MTRCEGCGAALAPGANWCGQCFSAAGSGPATGGRVSAGAGAATGGRVSAGAGYATDGQVSAAGGPSAGGPASAAAGDRFGAPPPPPPPPGWEPVAATWQQQISARHPGWRPPALPAQPLVPEPTIGSRRALALTAGAIGLGAILQGSFWILDHKHTLEPEALVRYSLVGTFTFYVIVLALVLRQVKPHVALIWSTRSKISALLIGPLVGAGLAGLGLALTSAAAGHLTTDPSITLLVSEGDPAHIATAVLITCVAAPFVEELLFRGLLLQSLRAKNARLALWVSAGAFSAWHLRPEALRYYVVMGLILGALYMKRGLLCSMSAHAAFNGVLSAAAIVLALSPGITVQAGSMSLHTPRGWHRATGPSGMPAVDAIALTGPSGAELLFSPEQEFQATTVSAERLAEVIRGGALDGRIPGVEFDDASTRILQLPAGPAVEVDITSQGHHGEYVAVLAPDDIYDLVFASSGSVRAEHDFTQMLSSLQTTSTP